jgi:hypothetical protein
MAEESIPVTRRKSNNRKRQSGADAYERIKRENEPLAQALLTYVIGVMAERLSFASKVIGVLRR